MTPTPFGYVPPGGVPPQNQTNQSTGFPTVQPGGLQNQPGGVQNQNPVPGAPGSGLPGSGISPGTGAGASSPAASTTPGSDPCYGDEQITYSPEEPRVGNELLVAVTSARPHPYGRLAGTERTQFVRERPGQKGYVWEWTIQPSYPGEHTYTFYVDSTIPCQKIS